MKEIKEKYSKEIYLNILKAIIIVLYFLVLNLAYENISAEHIELGIKIFTMVFLFISIYIFEKAYKKDDDKLAIQGIEILILSAYTLTSRHITNKFNFNFKNYSLVASYIFAIYFILKCIFVYTKGRKEEAENLSDIKEIVKKEEPVKKEATKKSKEDSKEDTEASTKTESEESAKTESKKSTSKKSTIAKKKTTTNKEETAKTENKKSTSKKSTTAKKKTTTKKEETANTENKKEEKTEKSEPSKRKTTTKKSVKKEIEENPKSEKTKRKQVKKEEKEND